MLAIDRLNDWIEILRHNPPHEPITLVPSELLHLLFDLEAVKSEMVVSGTAVESTIDF